MEAKEANGMFGERVWTEAAKELQRLTDRKRGSDSDGA